MIIRKFVPGPDRLIQDVFQGAYEYHDTTLCQFPGLDGKTLAFAIFIKIKKS